jgi:hypothetical protein
VGVDTKDLGLEAGIAVEEKVVSILRALDRRTNDVGVDHEVESSRQELAKREGPKPLTTMLKETNRFQVRRKTDPSGCFLTCIPSTMGVPRR